MCRSSHDVPVVPSRLSSRTVRRETTARASCLGAQSQTPSSIKFEKGLRSFRKAILQKPSITLVSFSYRRSHPPGSAARPPPALEERSSSPLPYRTRSCARSGGLALETLAETSVILGRCTALRKQLDHFKSALLQSVPVAQQQIRQHPHKPATLEKPSSTVRCWRCSVGPTPKSSPKT